MAWVGAAVMMLGSDAGIILEKVQSAELENPG